MESKFKTPEERADWLIERGIGHVDSLDSIADGKDDRDILIEQIREAQHDALLWAAEEMASALGAVLREEDDERQGAGSEQGGGCTGEAGPGEA